MLNMTPKILNMTENFRSLFLMLIIPFFLTFQFNRSFINPVINSVENFLKSISETKFMICHCFLFELNKAGLNSISLFGLYFLM